MIVDGFGDFDRVILDALQDRESSVVDRLQLFSKNYIEFAKDNPTLYRLLFSKKYEQIRQESETIRESGFMALKIAIKEGQESGVLKKEDSYHQAITLWASLHGLSSLLVDGFLDVDKIYEELSDRMIENLVTGLVD
jgi:hypothetical protein